MHEGYGSRSVCVYICVSVTMLTATYMYIPCLQVQNAVFMFLGCSKHVYCVDIAENALFSSFDVIF